MARKTKEEINEYVKSKKGKNVDLFTRLGKEYISFRNEKGQFAGWIEKSRDTINAVKRYIPIKTKIKFKFKGKREKKTVVYNVYNKKQQRQILFRMNKRLRKDPRYKREQKELSLEPTKFREDAVPFKEGKSKIDLLFDKYEFKPVEIEKFEGASP